MQSTTRSAARLARQRQRTLHALNDYSQLSTPELIEEAIGLHSSLATAGHFGRVAERGIRTLAIERLLLLDQEHRRRQPPTPREIRSAPATDRPAAA